MGAYDEVLQKYPDNVPVAVAAKLLGKSPAWVEFGLESGALPFGACVKKNRCAFHIAPRALVRYLEGDKMMPARELIDAVAEATARRLAVELHKKGGAA